MSSSSNKRMLFSSAASVVEGVDDMLMLILVRLPARSIFRFLCVSKKWNYIIFTPFFSKAYYTLRNKLGPTIIGRIYEVYGKDPRGDGRRFKHPGRTTINPRPVISTPVIYKIRKQYVRFINSSNGLTLFRGITNDAELHILNPVTMREVYLNGPYMGAPAFALVCEHNMHDLVLNYKVICCSGKREKDSYVTVQTYCSKTGEWTTSTPTVMGRLDDKLCTSTSSPLVVKDTVYWFTNKHHYLVVYYVASNKIQLVELPSECRGTFTLKLAKESRDDDLWLCMFDVESCCTKIWMMSGQEYDIKKLRSCAITNDSWIIMHTLSRYPAQALVAAPSEEETTNRSSRDYSEWWRGDVKCWLPLVVRFLMDLYRDQFGQHDFSCFEFFLCMEALTLSSYTL